MPVLGGVSNLENPLLGNIFNVDNILDVWNIDGENWGDISESDKSTVVCYPSYVKDYVLKRPKEYLGLGGLDELPKGKTAAKKPAKGEQLFDDLSTDESGKQLPRVFFPTEKNPSHTATKCTLEFSKETYSMTEIDSLICGAFKIINQYASSYLSNATAPDDKRFPFLWSSIYPQLPDGRPCYNKSGKYVVKLFIAGKWRRVVVLDDFPVSSAGHLCVASSSNRYELWPSILAKAIYTVYTACGYHEYLRDLTIDIKMGSHKRSAEKASQFVNFVIHICTGWLPQSSLNILEIFQADKESFLNTIHNLKCNNIQSIQVSEIPNESPIQLQSMSNVMSSSPSKKNDAVRVQANPNHDEHVKKTKKQIIDERKKIVVEVENIVDRINIREQQISKIDEGVNQIQKEICYFVVFRKVDGSDSMRIGVLPILGICQEFSHSSGKEEVSFLTNWVKLPVIAGGKTGVMTLEGEEVDHAEDVSKPSNRLFNPNITLPNTTPLEYQWLKMSDVQANSFMYFNCLDTKIHYQSTYEYNWHWLIPEEDTSKDKSKKKADKPKVDKKGGVISSVPVVGTPVPGTDPGSVPHSMLSIDLSNMNGVGLEGNEVSLAIFIHADVVGVPNGDITEYCIPSDTVLLLHEIRSDDLAPCVYRAQLSNKVALPFTKLSLNIPGESLQRTSGIFWLRVYTSNSVYLSFHCSLPIQVAQVSDAWLANRGTAIVEEGVTLPTHQRSEQILFRIPLQLPSNANVNEDDDGEYVFVFLYIANKANMERVSLFTFCSDNSAIQDTEEVTNGSETVQLYGKVKRNSILPRIEMNKIFVKRNTRQYLIGRCYDHHRNIPEFKWKISILSKNQLIPPVDVLPQCFQTAHPLQRFKSDYYANDRLVIFNDIISAPPEEFPLSFRLLVDNLLGVDPATLQDDENIIENTWIKVRIYNKTDKTLISEYYGRGMIDIFILDKHKVTGVMEETREKSPSKKDAKGTAKKGKNDDSGNIEFIMECLVDEGRMEVSNTWRSRYPHEFHTCTAQNPPHSFQLAPLFTCQLDVVGGKISRVTHNIKDLENRAEIKNSWENNENGRRDKAAAATAYMQMFYEDMKKKHASENHVGSLEERIKELSVALDKEEEVIKTRENKTIHLPTVCVYVCLCWVIHILLKFLLIFIFSFVIVL